METKETNETRETTPGHTEPTCCYLERVIPAFDGDDEPSGRYRACDKAAEWVIVHGPAPDDFMHACTAHVGDLLTNAETHYIFHAREGLS